MINATETDLFRNETGVLFYESLNNIHSSFKHTVATLKLEFLFISDEVLSTVLQLYDWDLWMGENNFSQSFEPQRHKSEIAAATRFLNHIGDLNFHCFYCKNEINGNNSNMDK